MSLLQNPISEKNWLNKKAVISLRIAGGKFIVSPADVPLNRLNEEDLLIAAIEKSTEPPSLNLSRHVEWHRWIYKNSAANAVVLCQPTFTTVLANRMQKPNKSILADANILLDSIHCVKPETEDPKDLIIAGHTLFIQSVGLLSWGKSINEVLDRIEIIEKMCEISCNS